MDSQSEQVLKETLELTRENNKLLHKLWKAQVWANIMRGIYWFILIGASVGAFYLLQPYVNKMVSLYNQVSGSTKNTNSLDFNSIGGLLNNYKITPK